MTRYTIIPGEGNGENSLPTFVVKRESKNKIQELFSPMIPLKRGIALLRLSISF